MRWLDSYKQKFDDEAAKKEAEAEAKSAMWKRHHEDADKELASFVKNSLQELVGKKTKDGKTIKLGKGEGYYAEVILWADNEKLLSIDYSYKEEEDSDRDGMSWGNGSYYLVKNMHLYKTHKNRYGSIYDKGRRCSLNEEELAHYLLILLE